ncbi:MAG TPA: redox-regulated ATPase YchF [Actinomycetota bacterium]|nr:redox-regulated ATPase YchF [Actinomycetota bacterium]
MLRVGIVGLPNAGKSTLFNALARAHAGVAPHPFTTTDPNVGETAVPDPRLERLAAALRPEKVVPAHIRFVDIAGLVRGAHRGEGLGNRFLGHVREMDALLLVLRAFPAEAVPHPEGDIDPARDLDTLITEMALADLETIGRGAERAGKRAAGSRDGAERERAAALVRAKEALERGEPVAGALSPDDVGRIRELFLLTAKPMLIVLNVGEQDAGEVDDVVARYPLPGQVVAVCAKLEEEVEDLPEGEAAELLDAYGVSERGTARIADAARRLLGLITFYSIESAECRAWLVPEGTTAVGAAGEIHTDMARGFIKADVAAAEALAEAGSLASARERGLIRSEGKDYVVNDGDVLTFRFRA